MRILSRENKEEVRKFIEESKEREYDEGRELQKNTQQAIRNLKEALIRSQNSPANQKEASRKETVLEIAYKMVSAGEEEAKIYSYTGATKEEINFLSRLAKSLRSAKGSFEAEGNKIQSPNVVFSCQEGNGVKAFVKDSFVAEMQEDGSIKTSN
ncbi:hypothetical protein [Evansella cellulosilytica]|uniref:Uncharacterized protein n=1 Tax=Evansella cellulosilytica (strain ATCC 21833 / DSM 2522 / FERM P-1141 / JCM 9156 / N-4) TaxID=649639 RepID=E6TQB4_EVAC2|nr:hypothetical protein [Evansella cellulosilytica]ADU29292.1 hypothetical protein Bcell_1019 [Evansella cellulosilytica DSM 2522]